MRESFYKLAKFCGRIAQRRVRFFEEFYFFKILVFRVRLIKNVELFVAQIYRAKAVLRTFAVVAPVTVAGVEAIAAKVAVIAVTAVHAFIAKFAFFYKGVIYAVAAEANPDAIRAVFGLHMSHNTVAVSASRVIRRVGAVFTSYRNNADLRTGLTEALEVIKKSHSYYISKK